MSGGVLNYTTTIAATKTVNEMQTMLGRAGAARISVDFDDGRPSAVSFMLATPHGSRHFTLPVNVEAMRRLLAEQRRRNRRINDSAEQAERVAWRILKDWLAAQLALVSTQMVSLDEVMLPYLHVDDAGRTLYAAYREHEAIAAIGQGGAS